MSSKRINTFANKIPSEVKKEIKITDTSSIPELLKDFKRNDKYEHLSIIGQGGMGKVTLSRDRNTLRKVAIKTLKDDLLENHEAIIRFTEEAQITAQLEHPNIIPVYEMGLNSSSAPFYSMKYVKGTNLKEILKLIKDKNEIIMRKFHLIELLNIFVKICDAMAFACSKGVLHRDLKPENIMIGEFGEVLILDWGLSKTYSKSLEVVDFDESQIASQINSFIDDNIDTIRSINNVSLSMDNCLIGTPQYMAPERIVGKGDEKSEVFGLGAILHDILALAHMFTASEVQEVLKKIALGEYEDLKNYKNLPHISGGKIPPALIAVVEKATQKDPANRYNNINELKYEIEAYILGYATKAESAGFFRLLKLGLIRHKKVSIFAFLLIFALLFVSGVFIYELVHSKQNALNKSNYANFLKESANRKSFQVSQKSKELENKINELKSHSDIILENGLYEADQLNFVKAKEYVEDAIYLNPGKESYYQHLGRINLTLMKFEEAINAFRRVSETSEKYEVAQVLLRVSEDLYDEEQSNISKEAEKNISDESIEKLFKLLVSKYEYSEAIYVLKKLKKHEKHDEYLFSVWDKRLRERNKLSAVLDHEKTHITVSNGKFIIKLNGAPIFNLQPFEKMPISEIRLTNVKIENLNALKGQPLEIVSLNKTGITNLSPISEAQLTELTLIDTPVSSLKPLEKMKLTKLNIINCPVSDLTPLKDMKITRLTIQKTLVTNLIPLKDMKLKYFNAMYTRVKSIAALRDMKLSQIHLSSTPVNNIDVLTKMAPSFISLDRTLITSLPKLNTKNLEELYIGDTPLRSIENLNNAKKLKKINISNTQITDITHLKKSPLTHVYMTGTAASKIWGAVNPNLVELHLTGSYASDLTHLKHAKKLKILYAGNCGISDISPLKDLPLKELELSGNAKLSSIEALKGIKLKRLYLRSTNVSNLEPLKNMPLVTLSISNTPVENIKPLSTLPFLEDLYMTGCKNIYSLKPLLEIKSLLKIHILKNTPGMQILRNHSSLKFININGVTRSAEQYWDFQQQKLERKSDQL